tara:strand:- start:3553 stop:3981 length:429 start_codon:yes stop_codon:yes gene_type:complete
MLSRLNIERKKEVLKLNQEIGNSFSIFYKLKNRVFGSPKYQITSLSPDIIDLENENGTVNINFEIRPYGIAGYFRLHHDEYCLYCKYSQLSFMKSGDDFVMQFPRHLLKLKINNITSHKLFVQRFYDIKNQRLIDECSVENT